MIKFRYKRKEEKEKVVSSTIIKSEIVKINTSINKSPKDNKKDGKPPKGVKKEYLDCVRAVVVSLKE